ncbi:MAG: hypothetical protein N3I35_10665 [Clostridia bacterium]|nr:hypothetical protein [Clostridia bacterium]
MVNCIKISGYKDKQVIGTDIFFEGTLVYLDNENYYEESDPSGWIPGIIKHNSITKLTDYHKFETNIRNASYKNTKDTMYYVISKQKYDTVCLQFKKVNCFDFSEENIFSLEFNISKMHETQYSLLKHVDIHGINSRYSLVRIPQIDHKYGLPQYSQILLLDSIDKNHFIVPGKLGIDDTMLRLDRIEVSDDGTFLLIKTGNICWFEKKDFWEIGRKDYYDQLESLLLIDIESFVHHIKNGTEIPGSFIIDKCGFESAFTNFEIIDKELKYQKVNFRDNITELLTHAIISKQTTKINIECIYENIIQFDSKIFVISKDGSNKKIIDVINNKCIFSTSALTEQIIYFDNENVITAIPQEGLIHEIVMHSINSNKAEKLGVGWFTFNKKQKILTIFN